MVDALVARITDALPDMDTYADLTLDAAIGFHGCPDSVIRAACARVDSELCGATLYIGPQTRPGGRITAMRPSRRGVTKGNRAL